MEFDSQFLFQAVNSFEDVIGFLVSAAAFSPTLDDSSVVPVESKVFDI